MPKILVTATLLLGLLIGGAMAQTPLATPMQSSFTPQQRAEIVTILREALQTDPSILRDAIESLQADETARRDAGAQAAIAQASPTLATKVDAVAGNPNGDVTVVEFYDVRCPYCRRMLPVAAAFLQRDPRVRWVFKEIPILGPSSVLAARAVLAAQRQDSYAAMHDALMTGTPDITPAVIDTVAEHLGLDVTRLRRDMDDPAIQARIDTNIALAHQLNVDGTPAYVIGTHMIDGAVDLANLERAVATARGR
jgi:protein-disulfide isomerase